MSYIINKIGILKDAFMGNLMKVKVLYDIRIRKNITLSPVKDDSTIVSLTSYGKRVNGSALYTIYSLLKQNIRPERVVLWLNEDEYNDDNITSDLRFLFDYGLDVRYAKDIRSYTKIIHSLKLFPDKHIITADDDIYYTKNFVEEFVNAHRLHPKAIITGFAKDPILDTNNHLKTYSDWPEYHHVPASFEYDKMKILPLGWAGVFYPTTLCPKADDIWLYIMGLRSNAEKRILPDSHIAYYHTDLLRQYFTKDRLTATNRFGGENDVQLKALLEHYELSIK